MQCKHHMDRPASDSCARCGEQFCSDCLREAEGGKLCPDCAGAAHPTSQAVGTSARLCKNHPEAEAVNRCSGCQEAFCRNCLVEINGQPYCESCKSMAIPKRGIPEILTRPHEDAKQALKYALIGILCFGVVLGPMAVYNGFKARAKIKGNLLLTGYGQANAAIVIGAAVFLFWFLNLILRIRGMR